MGDYDYCDYEDDYISERELNDELYGDECICCGHKLDGHDNNICNEANA
jgi:hypothetical protein